MKIQKANINDLISPEYNPREITEEEMDKLKLSIEEFGYVDPIIVNEVNNHIIGGNQRYEALKEMGYEEVEVNYVHIEDLNREKSLNIMLNKVSGDWDNDKLTEIFKELKVDGFDLSLTGFDEFELDFYLDDDVEFSNPFDYEDEEEEEPEDYVDVEGERTNEQYVVSISFRTKERANEFLDFLDAPYKLTQRSVGIHDDEITWENSDEV